MAHTWDANGNLLNDGVYTYTYDMANHLIAAGGAVVFRYNGLGERLQETRTGVTTTFTVDLQAGLTQVLSDGAHTYL